MKVLLVGLKDTQKSLFSGTSSETQTEEINDMAGFESLLTDYQGPGFDYIAVGTTLPELSASELAQSLRSLFAQSRLVFLTEDKKGYSRSDYIKNGFDETFLLPTDKSILKKELADYFNFTKTKEKLKPVRLIDIKPGEVLDFNVYVFLTKNNKYILYNKANEPLEPERLERLLKYHLDVIFVPESQLKSFYKYSAKKLKDIYKEAHKMSKTEKLEILQREVRNMFHAIFEDKSATDFEAGKAILNDCKNIIALFLGDSMGGGDWYEKMMGSMSIDEFDPYSHSVHTSVMASLLALGLGMQNVEDFAIAGLFHDIGLEDNSKLLMLQDIDSLNPQDAEIYKQHPLKSVALLKDKRIIVSSMVQKMIEQHHENCLGTGFPNKITPDKFPIESQLMAISNEIDKLTRPELKKDRKRPIKIIEEFIEERRYDIALLKGIHKLFLN